MKQIISKLVYVLTAVILLTACDPGYTEIVSIRNASSHTVTIIPISVNGSVETAQTYTLAPNEEFIIAQLGGIGTATYEEGFNMFRQFLLSYDRMIFDFGDSGIVYSCEDTTGIGPYNLQSENFSYEERQNEGPFFNGYSSYGKFTYSITDEHYNLSIPYINSAK
ncbi:MAG: hypothetical protein K6A41_08755 [Bacteroidales bacterium]|nr:hypothetical protein [Bacteroidales bacterium]